MLTEEGSKILDQLVEQAPENACLIKSHVIFLKVAYVLIIRDSIYTMYFISNLQDFARYHQELLDSHPSLNGFSAAIQVLNTNYKVFAFV